ncbi:putative ribonuclease H-like domain-containing protein [Tanacetum coccineum]
MRKKSSQREIRPIWNNVQRVNHKNQFVPTTVLTRTRKIPVNTAKASGINNVSTARHDFNRQAVPTNAAMKVNTVKPIVNRVRPANVNTAEDEGLCSWVSYKARLFRVYNLETKRVEENLHITFLENKPNVAGKGPTWLFDLDYLTDSMNYQPVRSDNQANKHAGPQEANHNACIKDNIDAGDSEKEDESAQDYFVLHIWSSYSSTVKRSTAKDAGEAPHKHPDLKTGVCPRNLEDLLLQARVLNTISTNIVNIVNTPVSTASPHGGLTFTDLTNPNQDDSEIPALEEIYDNPTDGRAAAIQDSESLDSVDLPYGKKAIGTKWVYRNKKDERGVVVRNISKVYKKSWCDEFEALMKSRFQMSSMGELTFFLGLQVKQKEEGIFISQDKYVAKILKKFDFVSVKTASTPIETQKPLVKDEEASDVDVHLYRSMIGSLMYLTTSRPDIMFVVCACSRFQVTPKTSHLSVVKRIFRYLKGKPKLGLWYPRVSSFDLEAYSDSDYAGANLDRKSTTGEAEYVAAANCCGQVLWIQNQMLDYGFNFMNTKIYIDNESTICIVKNPVYHSKTKHIAIRHHFIRDAYEKKLIQVLKIYTDDNVVDLLTLTPPNLHAAEPTIWVLNNSTIVIRHKERLNETF